MSRIKWDGNAKTAFDVPEGLTVDTKVMVYGKDDFRPQETTAGEMDWRHFNTLDPKEQAFLRLLGVSEETDLYSYEVIE